jgi:hypothetical protein
MIMHSMAQPEKFKPSEGVELKVAERAAVGHGTIQPAGGE